MSHATLEEILKEAEALPPNERRLLPLVLKNEVVASLIVKARSLTSDEQRQLLEAIKYYLEAIDIARKLSGSASETNTVSAVRGKYAHLPTGSEEFAALKHEEIELEDRR